MSPVKSCTQMILLAGLSAVPVSPCHANSFETYETVPWEICALCHSLDGNSRMPKFPKLAGQKAQYIERQLVYFNEGLRTNDGGQMASISSEITRQQYAVVAAYFSTQPPSPIDPPKPEHLSEIKQGNALYNRWQASGLSCASCHSDPESDAPWLDSQHFSYLIKQLSDFSKGERGDIHSQRLHGTLSNDEIRAFAHYASAQQIRPKSQ